MEMTEMINIGGIMVPRIAVSKPIMPPILYPIITEALTGRGPGEDCVIAVISNISLSSSHLSSSTNFFFINDTMTKPPPKVHALKTNIDLNRIHNVLTSAFLFIIVSILLFIPFLFVLVEFDSWIIFHDN